MAAARFNQYFILQTPTPSPRWLDQAARAMNSTGGWPVWRAADMKGRVRVAQFGDWRKAVSSWDGFTLVD